MGFFYYDNQTWKSQSALSLAFFRRVIIINLFKKRIEYSFKIINKGIFQNICFYKPEFNFKSIEKIIGEDSILKISIRKLFKNITPSFFRI